MNKSFYKYFENQFYFSVNEAASTQYVILF